MDIASIIVLSIYFILAVLVLFSLGYCFYLLVIEDCCLRPKISKVSPKNKEKPIPEGTPIDSKNIVSAYKCDQDGKIEETDHEE